MPKRKHAFAFLLILVSVASACKKSSESHPPNFFGSPPVVSDVSITKQSRHFQCDIGTQPLCCVDPPLCSCCCVPDQATIVSQDIDLVQISATVTDADGDANLLVILARFFDPPTGNGVNEISLEMFDTGPAALGTVHGSAGDYPVISGDTTAGDKKFTRYFYMKSVVLATVGDCVLSTDTSQFGGTYSQFSLTDTFPATKTINFTYHVEAVDRAGNITPSSSTTLSILETQGASQTTTKACGPPTGAGGCQPPP